MGDRSFVAPSGRQFDVATLTPIERFRAFKAIPGDLATNSLWLSWAFTAMSVRSIDGVPVPPATNESQIESMVVRIGDDMVSLMQWMMDEASAQRELAGNSDGTPSS